MPEFLVTSAVWFKRSSHLLILQPCGDCVMQPLSTVKRSTGVFNNKFNGCQASYEQGGRAPWSLLCGFSRAGILSRRTANTCRMEGHTAFIISSKPPSIVPKVDTQGAFRFKSLISMPTTIGLCSPRHAQEKVSRQFYYAEVRLTNKDAFWEVGGLPSLQNLNPGHGHASKWGRRPHPTSLAGQER
jgi:hypothetical protein